ncbi:MAG TPA: polyprenyl diphosphate synthase [Anaerolineaceae bacterium]|nr:polyprenyl diphosphate synthase [Anaerolineaceae bacterium]
MIQKNMNHLTIENPPIPRHVGIIMDGNGRWAQIRGLPRSAGHKAGVQKAREMIKICADLGIEYLTLYTFSTENWGRPLEEVNQIMMLAEQCVESELPEMQRNGVRLQLMGKRDGLPDSLLEALDRAILQTQNNSRFTLYLALNYGGRVEIVDAVKAILSSSQPEEFIDNDILAHHLYCPDCPDIDLVIRTGGEWRLSNFMLWRTAHAVFWSTPVYWPGFDQQNLEVAMAVYADQLLHQNDGF